ncbi:MAG: sodium:solute symporter family protein [Anaerovoracaceae bacterium]
MGTLDYIVIVLFLVTMLVIGFIAKGQVNNMDDFILGGRRFNKFALTGTILATMMGSGMTMGAVGNVYGNGIGGSMFWIYAGFAIGLFALGFMSKSIRKTGARSLAEIVNMAFGKYARLASAMVVIIYAVSLVAINIAGFRTIIIYGFGDDFSLSIAVATTIATLVCITFTAVGGMFAVVWTDTAQLVIMIVGLFVLGPIIGIAAADGVGNIAAEVTSQGLSMTNPLVDGMSPVFIGLALSYFLACPGDPTMPQRVLSAKTDGTAKFSFIISGFCAILFTLSILFIGCSIMVLMPGLDNADSALPLFIVNYYPPVLKGIAIAGIIAAVMSSFSSFLILATTHITYDVGRVIKEDLDEKKINKAMPILTIIIGLLGLVVALYIQSLLGYLTMVFSIVGASLVPVLFAALYFKEKTSRFGAISSIIVGALVPAVLFMTKGYDVFLGDPVFLGLFSAIAVLVLGSILVKDKKKTEVIA